MHDPLDDLPRIHPREKIVDEAEQKLRAVVFELIQSELTQGEFLKVLGNVMDGEIRSIAKYAIRRERHGDEDKPGGIA